MTYTVSSGTLNSSIPYHTYCKLFFFLIFDVIFSIAMGVQHDGRLPFWKPASVFAHYVRIIIVFTIGEINILLLVCPQNCADYTLYFMLSKLRKRKQRRIHP